MTSAQASRNEDWKAIKRDADDERAALEARRLLLEAHKALEAAEAPPQPDAKPTERRLMAARAAKELADAEKSAADARKAEADSAMAVMKARIGEVPSSGYSSDVSLKDRAGTAEAALLSAKAIRTAAECIVKGLSNHLKDSVTVLVYPATDAPRLNALLTLRAQMVVVSNAFVEAEGISSSTDSTDTTEKYRVLPIPPAGAAGLALETVSKLLGFFRTDYAVGGVEVKYEDSLLIHALAGNIVKTTTTLKVSLPGTYNPLVLSATSTGILEELGSLSRRKAVDQNKATYHYEQSSVFTKAAEQEVDASKKKDLEKNARTHKAASDALRVAIAVYDDFLGKLTAINDKGAVLLTDAVRDAEVFDALSKGAFLLLVKLHFCGGSYYTQKNMWSLFGGMPFSHMGGVVVSYVLLDGKQGTVAASDVLPVHGGFVRSTKVKKALGK